MHINAVNYRTVPSFSDKSLINTKYKTSECLSQYIYRIMPFFRGGRLDQPWNNPWSKRIKMYVLLKNEKKIKPELTVLFQSIMTGTIWTLQVHATKQYYVHTRFSSFNWLFEIPLLSIGLKNIEKGEFSASIVTMPSLKLWTSHKNRMGWHTDIITLKN